jgi:hypothetical protein
MKRKATATNDSENQQPESSAKRRRCARNQVVLHEIALNIPNIFKRQSPSNSDEWVLDYNNNYVQRVVTMAPPVIRSMDCSTQTPHRSSEDSYRTEMEELYARLRALKESK